MRWSTPIFTKAKWKGYLVELDNLRAQMPIVELVTHTSRQLQDRIRICIQGCLEGTKVVDDLFTTDLVGLGVQFSD